MANGPKEPNQVDKEKLVQLVKARELRESKEYGNSTSGPFIVYTAAQKAEVTFWFNGSPKKAIYELSNKGAWYCSYDWLD